MVLFGTIAGVVEALDGVDAGAIELDCVWGDGGLFTRPGAWLGCSGTAVAGVELVAMTAGWPEPWSIIPC